MRFLGSPKFLPAVFLAGIAVFLGAAAVWYVRNEVFVTRYDGQPFHSRTLLPCPKCRTMSEWQPKEMKYRCINPECRHEFKP